MIIKLLQVAELASLAQLLFPHSPTVRNPAPDSSLCRAAPRLCPLQLLLAACVASAAAPGPNCGIRFNCCSPGARLPPLPAAASGPDCGIRFNCCSPGPRLPPLPAAAPDRVRFGCYSPIASASTAAPRLHLLDSSPCHARAQCSRTFFAEFEVQ